MKKGIPLLVAIMGALGLSAQEAKTWLNSNAQISGFGGFDLGIHLIDGSSSPGFGGGGAMLINRTFWIGGFGEGIGVNKYYTYLSNNGERVISLGMGYGGLWTGYKWAPEDLIHPQFEVRLGWGGVSVEDAENGRNYANTAIFVFLPSAGVEMNVTQVFRIQLMARYRAVSGSDLELANSRDLSGLSASLAFVFGWF